MTKSKKLKTPSTRPLHDAELHRTAGGFVFEEITWDIKKPKLLLTQSP